MRGLVRPCRHQLTPQLRERWRAHLCGLCLTLRAESGQAARLLTGYDVLLLSVLVEAQAGPAATEIAGPCPLRAMRTASVVRADTPAMQVAAAGTLLTGAAGLVDKLIDGDLPVTTRRGARRWAGRFDRDGRRVATRVGVDADAVVGAASAAAALEQSSSAGSLDTLLAPTGHVVAELFAATAHAADRPHNEPALRRAGDAFGRLVHLGDALEDLDDDVAHGRFNPLTASATSPDEAAARATALHEQVVAALDDVAMADRDLAVVLFGPVLAKTVRGWQPRTVPAPRSAPSALVFTGIAAAVLGVFGGPPRRRRRYYDDPRYDPRYEDPRYDPRYDRGYGAGYGRGYRRGPGCCDLLACDCCASMACSEACGGDCCVCCV